jgi:chromosome segregation ATPase
LEPELASLRHELQQKAWALAQQQASVENLALAHRNQIQKLEDRLAEQQRNYQDRTGETERAQSQTRSLQRRIEELEMELQHAQLTTVRGAQQIREEYARRIEESNAEVERRRAELQEREAAQSRLEETFRAEIERLVREAEERNLILQNRNDELVQAKSARDALQESYNELASATTRNEAAVSEDVERMRTEFQAQLALLQAELSQKEWALEEQRASASGMDQQYREQIEALRRQLARTEARAPENQETFVLGDGALTEEQQQRYIKHREVMDVVTTSENRTFPASENRRWRSTFGWKRRWK